MHFLNPEVPSIRRGIMIHFVILQMDRSSSQLLLKRKAATSTPTKLFFVPAASAYLSIHLQPYGVR